MFDRVLLTVHPPDCQVREFFAQRLAERVQGSDLRRASRLPTSPADLMAEHIERVLSHVQRLETSAEGAVQLHFSALSNRTNSIMRTLTVLTAIFLPLNLIIGIFWRKRYLGTHQPP